MLRKTHFEDHKKNTVRNKFNEYTYLLKYIKEKDIQYKKSHLEENSMNYAL